MSWAERQRADLLQQTQSLTQVPPAPLKETHTANVLLSLWGTTIDFLSIFPNH